MDWYRRRPLFWWALCFLIGMLLRDYLNNTVIWLLTAATVSLLLIFIFRRQDALLFGVLIGSLILSGSFRRQHSVKAPAELLAHLADSSSQVIYTGIIGQVDTTGRYALRVETRPYRIYNRYIEAQPVEIWLPKQVDVPSPHDTIVCVGQFQRFPPARNPGAFDYRKYQMKRQRYFQLRVQFPWEVRIRPGEQPLLQAIIAKSRRAILSIFQENLSPTSADFAAAIVLGERKLVDENLLEIYSSLGLIHVMAVSGLHVGFVVLILMVGAQLTRLKLPLRVVLVMLGLAFYAALVEFRPSVVRASVMASGFLIALASQRRYDLLNILGFAGLSILVVQPLQLYQLGFQLSFLAVLGIILISERLVDILEDFGFPITEANAGVRWTGGMIVVSFAAFLGTVPITAYHFHIIPIWGVLFNLLVVPAIGFIVICIFTLVFASLVWTQLGVMYAALPEVSIRLLHNGLEFFDGIGFQAIRIPSYSGLAVVLLYGAILGFVFWRYTVVKRFVVYGVLVGLNVWLLFAPKSSPELLVTFFDVGQGDGALVELSGRGYLLVDAGKRSLESDDGTDVILPYLQSRGIRSLDILAVSHFDADHAGGVPALLQNMPVNEIWYAARSDTSPLFKEIIALANEHHTRLRPIQAGFDTSLGRLKIRTLYPVGIRLNESRNDHSLVQRLIFGETSVLFTGDIGKEVERYLLPYESELRSEVLKVPHHGSNTSSLNEFIRSVDPACAVISVGAGNKFNLPSTVVLRRYAASKSRLLLTSKEGAVLFKSEGNGWQRVRWRK